MIFFRRLDVNLENIYALIWTTTPWSLLGNQAVALNEKLDYVFVRSSTNDVYLIAESLLKTIEKLPAFVYSPLEIVGKSLGIRYDMLTSFACTSIVVDMLF
jgi:isoleucyl-tRNA synthetase